ncbi:Clp protease ClpP, partial [Salmonella enterica]|nr:Clp protease ClpP [Salmonella enterica]ECE0744480.1 Clp protease ClpP [Salmonella enterica subsp. enterica serovar Meleagridis]EEK0870698.1 Clp protease ClpP [Salmonella enterica subsp. enterica serovar Dublin]EHL8190483.1 Clp protease ClpP [Salmonella enterica subsp. enterica serovar Give]ELG9717088.1 Clp protease ClpP [Salmonella enterica subsp. enterica serovar Newbrunswick]
TVQKLMDAESYIGGSDAVEKGLADSLLSADAVSDGDETPAAALRKLDALLAKTNTPRSERRKLIKALSGGMSGAATNHDGTPGAAEEIKPEIINSLENALAALVK